MLVKCLLAEQHPFHRVGGDHEVNFSYQAVLMAPYFFNCDWGTSRFRLRLVQVATGEIVAQRSSSEGAAVLATGTVQSERGPLYAQVLGRHVEAIASEIDIDASQTPILISGMASSSIGWCNLPYATLPFRLDGSDLPWRSLDAVSGHPVYLFSGVRAECDVMRGEELEVIGLAVQTPELSRASTTWVVLPGTHSKHLCLQDGKLVNFRTYMTGELYQLLQEHSSLQHSLPQQPSLTSQPTPAQQAAFADGVALAQNGELTSALFKVRATQLLHGFEADASAALLSGILIGNELASLARVRNSDSSLVLCANATFRPLYQHALDLLGLGSVAMVVPADEVDQLSAIGQWKVFASINPTPRPRTQNSMPRPAAFPSPTSIKPTPTEAT